MNGLASLSQFRKDEAYQVVSLRLHVAERRGNESPHCPPWLRHDALKWILCLSWKGIVLQRSIREPTVPFREHSVRPYPGIPGRRTAVKLVSQSMHSF